LANRSSTAISVLLSERDRPFRAVGDGQARGTLGIGRDDAVAENQAVSLVVFAEQLRDQVVTAPVALAQLRVDLQPHNAPPVSEAEVS
jgi:hypothetical protein